MLREAYMDIRKYKDKIKFLALVIGLVLLWYLGRYFHIQPDKIETSLMKMPLLASGAIFIALYVVVTFFLWLSKDIFKLVCAFLFGAYISTLLILIAESINAFILFRLSRYLGRGFLQQSLGEKYNGLDEKLANINLPWLLLFRAVPLIPFRFLDLAMGLTGISFRRYWLAVVLGSPLRIFWVQYIISGVGKDIFKNPYALMDYLSLNKPVFIFSFLYFILVIFVALKIKRINRYGNKD